MHVTSVRASHVSTARRVYLQQEKHFHAVDYGMTDIVIALTVDLPVPPTPHAAVHCLRTPSLCGRLRIFPCMSSLQLESCKLKSLGCSARTLPIHVATEPLGTALHLLC
jgi:hypothetical protein